MDDQPDKEQPKVENAADELSADRMERMESLVSGTNCSSYAPRPTVQVAPIQHSVIGVGSIMENSITIFRNVLPDPHNSNSSSSFQSSFNPYYIGAEQQFPHGRLGYVSGDSHAIAEQKLNKVLKKRAKEISGTLSLPIELNLAIKFEELELKDDMERSFSHLDNEGHYNRRTDFKKILMQPCVGNIKLDQIFDQACKKAEVEATYRTTNTEARNAYVKRYGNIVVLLGQAGIGKTTLAKKMLQHVSDGNFFTESSYVFYISFRELDFESETTLFRFMMTGCDNWKHVQETDAQLVDKLNHNPNVMFIFDGLDEADTDRLSQKNTLHTQSVLCKPDTFLRKIFTGQIFSSAKKLFTSRPRQFYELDPDCRPHFVVDILGLNQESQDQLGRQICQDKFEKIKEFLHGNPDVMASCYVPAKCIIIYGILVMSMDGDDSITIRSLTDIFVEALCYFSRSEHLRGGIHEVWKLAFLAWNGFINRKIIFTPIDFNNIAVNAKAVESFLSTTTEGNIRFSILEGEKNFSFTHLVWQEFFAAINAMFLLSAEEFEQYLTELTNPLWEVVSKFMFGLCYPAMVKKVKMIFPLRVVKDLDAKKEKLFEVAVTLMKTCFDSQKQLLLLQICSWVQEAHDSVLTTEVTSHFPEEIYLSVTILPSDVSYLIYVLRRIKKSIYVNASEATFTKDSLQRLLKGFSTLPIKMKALVLDNIPINEDAIAQLAGAVANTEELHLRGCNLSQLSMNMLSRTISLLQQPMEELQLSGNAIDYETAASIAEALPNIKKLHLNDCQLSSDAITLISRKVACLKLPRPKVYGDCGKL